MRLWFFVEYALKDLFKNKVMFSLITVSIALASIALLSTSSVLLGFSNALESGNKGWLSDLVITSKDKNQREIVQIKSVLQTIENNPNVVATARRSYDVGSLKVNDK